ncbi:hypothetical protein EVAR_90260_1 [Eumeta japonica]|uniref:Regulatory protein zeste n=1 Tax=Eumeta variegata TaxID=151549 RepID=A0A4C2AGH5_EUMVA|nr:hypothetical protein EVAR_90260_1 [Eumeta japonica]
MEQHFANTPQRMRASPEQFSALVDFMERYGDLSRPQPGAQGRLRADRLWQELTNLLNSMGGGVRKSVDKWRKTGKLKQKKYLLLRRHASGTGGGPSSRQVLTALEERIVAIMGVSAAVGQAGIQEHGFNRTSQPSEVPSAQRELSVPSLLLEVPHVNNVIAIPLNGPKPAPGFFLNGPKPTPGR